MITLVKIKIMSQPISFPIYYKLLDSFLWICINQPFPFSNSLAIIRPPMIRCNVQYSFSLMLVLWKASCISWRTLAQDKLPQLRALSVTLPLSVKVKIIPLKNKQLDDLKTPGIAFLFIFSLISSCSYVAVLKMLPRDFLKKYT